MDAKSSGEGFVRYDDDDDDDDARYVQLTCPCLRLVLQVFFPDHFPEIVRCKPPALDRNKIRGKIVVCENFDNQYKVKERLKGVTSHGGIGIVLIDDDAHAVASTYGTSPISIITEDDATELLLYICSST